MKSKSKVAVKEVFDEIGEDIEYLESPMEKIQYILDMAKEFENSEFAKKEEFKIQGCVSDAYIALTSIQELNNKEIVTIDYYADALIIQGFLAILKQSLDNSFKEELEENIIQFKEFSNQIGLEQFLSPNRSNALHNIIEKLQLYS
ncbi:MAG: SufE family protein [Candidatus Nanoarchaeia archaeon]